jgi:tetratricopeptide (TPR) repeat protein
MALMNAPLNDRQSVTELSNMAAVYRKRGQFDHAKTLYQSIIDDMERAPQSDQRLCLVLDQLGETLAEQEQLEEALLAYKRAVTLWETVHYAESTNSLWYADTLTKMQKISAQLAYTAPKV